MTHQPVFDPVCGMKITPDEAIVLRYEGVDLHFCSEACRQEFLRHPRAYIEVPKTPAQGR